MTRKTHQPKLLIIGIDGATFDLILPWAESGQLPVFRRLLGEGVHGRLISSVPPVTAPAWTSFMTGKNPGKHGLYHFIEPQPPGYGIRYSNRLSCRSESMWQILCRAGLSVGVINVPMTYPPEPVNGYMISGMDAPEDDRRITYPPDLYQELEAKFGRVNYQVRHLGYLKSEHQRDDLLNTLKEINLHYLSMTEYLIEAHPTDVVMVVFTSTDTVQHFFWHYMDPNHPQYDPKRYTDAVLNVYKSIDRIIGKLAEKLPNDSSLMLMSDHGFGPTSARSISMNRWLSQIGVLKTKPRSDRGILSFVMKKADAILRTTLTPRHKAKLAQRFPRLRKKWEYNFTGLANIDWENTRAYCHEILFFPTGIRINLRDTYPFGIVSPGKEYNDLIAFLRMKLYELKDPVTGRQLIRKVCHKDEVYHGPYLSSAPDLIPVWWEGINFSTAVSFPENKNKDVIHYSGNRPVGTGEWSGTHAAEGILLLHGNLFHRGITLEQPEITDLAPTLLHGLGIPVPEDMDGRVLSAAFLSDRDILTQKAADACSQAGAWERGENATYSDEDSAKIAERLRALGYM